MIFIWVSKVANAIWLLITGLRQKVPFLCEVGSVRKMRQENTPRALIDICNRCGYMCLGYANQLSLCHGGARACRSCLSGGQTHHVRFPGDSVNTNPVIIRRLLLALQEAKLVETRKGAGHGSRLARTPGRISLAEVYRAVEDEESFAMPPRSPNQDCPVGHCVQEAIEEVFISARKGHGKGIREDQPGGRNENHTSPLPGRPNGRKSPQ